MVVKGLVLRRRGPFFGFPMTRFRLLISIRNSVRSFLSFLFFLLVLFFFEASTGVISAASPIARSWAKPVPIPGAPYLKAVPGFPPSD